MMLVKLLDLPVLQLCEMKGKRLLPICKLGMIEVIIRPKKKCELVLVPVSLTNPPMVQSPVRTPSLMRTPLVKPLKQPNQEDDGQVMVMKMILMLAIFSIAFSIDEICAA